MSKRIKCKEVEDIILEFNNGEEIVLRYTMNDIVRFFDLDGGIKNVLNEESKTELCAKILYVGAVRNNDNFTLEKARQIVSNLSVETITMIMDSFTDSIGVDVDFNNMDEKTKKMLAKLILTMK